MKREGLVILVGFSLLAGCDNAADFGEIAPLVAGGEGNASVVVELADQFCVRGMAEESAFGTALSRSGWTFRRTQRGDPSNSLSLEVWESDGVTIIRSPHFDQGFRVCSLGVSREFAPDLSETAMELTRLTSVVPHDQGWDWRPSLNQRAKIDVSQGAIDDPEGIMIFVENYDVGLSGLGL